MTKPQQLIVAVGTAGLSEIAGPVVSAAFAFMSDVPEPLFSYTDRTGVSHRSRLLSTSAEVPPYVQRSLRENLVLLSSGASYGIRDGAYVNEHGLLIAEKKAAGVAVIRLFERLSLTCPEMEGMGLENIVVLSPFREKLEELPRSILQTTGTECWQVAAARFAAAHRHRDAMHALAERHPGYDFTKHLGQNTPSHRRVLRLLGPTPDHRLPL